MSDYSVTQVRLADEQIAEQLPALMLDAYGRPIRLDEIWRTTAMPEGAPSLFVAATIGTELIGFNAFIAHRLILNGKPIEAFQSCWTATSSRHRGKRVFQNLIGAGHEFAKERGGAFVFGFPNDQSYPLFVHKLGYRVIPSTKWQSPNFPLIGNIWYEARPVSAAKLTQDAIFQDERQLIALKTQKYGNAIKVAQIRGSVAWGVRRVKHKARMPVPYLDIGGISLDQPGDMRELLSKLRAAAGMVAYTQLVTNDGAPYAQLLRKMSPAMTNCLIVHDLNQRTEDLRFNLFNGIRDVY